ncbi:MAG: DPP IV N-terminal domain-containing protein, partial [Planctomycetota bacterium]|nr:DPP IV N-terminal domain-containing protein [Planctomycetota bacterium]
AAVVAAADSMPRRPRFHLFILLIGPLIAAGCASTPRADEEPALVGHDLWRIAFSSTRDENYDVYTMKPDGSDQRNLTANDAVDWAYASDDRIFYVSNRDRPSGGGYDLFVTRPDASFSWKITQFPIYDSIVGISRDGERFAVASRKDGDGEIYLIDIAGRELAQLTDNDAHESDPDLSPDGRSIVFRSDRDGPWDLYIMNLDGANVRRLTNHRENDHLKGYGGEGPARFSPDGSKILFMSHRHGSWDLYTIRPDGSDLTRLTFDDSDESYGAWSPDGRFIAFNSNRGDNYDICLMRADGSGVRRLTSDPASDQAPSWVTDAALTPYFVHGDGDEPSAWIFIEDARLAAQRDDATRRNDPAAVARDYAAALRGLTVDRRAAWIRGPMRAHADAWAGMASYLAAHSDERGEMHEIFARLEDAASNPTMADFRKRLYEIWSTWWEVERTAKANEVNPDAS